MSSRLLFILVLFAEVSAVVLDADNAGVEVVRDLTDRQLSMGDFHSSPQCWMSSIARTTSWNVGDNEKRHVHSSGSSYCASMDADQQEVLALELTNCQLAKEHEHLFEAIGQEAASACMVGGSGPYEASACLPLMSRYARSLYHKILLHVQNVCIRLTEQLLLLQQREAAQMLVHASSEVTKEIQMQAGMVSSQRDDLQQIQEHTGSLKTHQRDMLHASSEMLQQMDAIKGGAATAREEIQMQVSLLEDQSLLVSDQKDDLHQIHEHAEKIRVHQHDMEMSLRNREKEAVFFVEKSQQQMQEIVEMMKAETTTLIVEQNNKMKEQADEIQKQKRDLEQMEEIISSASSHMQSFSSIESYVKLATGGITIMKAIVNLFLSLNVAWLITSMPLLRRGRQYMFGLFGFGFLAEVAAMWFSDNGLIQDMGIDDIETLRNLTRAVAALSFFLSCFLPSKKDVSSITMDELMKSQMEIISKLNAPTAAETSAESIDFSNNCAETPRPVRGKSSGGADKSIARTGPEEFLTLHSSRNCKPTRHHSRLPCTELTQPVVTPIKPRSQNDAAASSNVPTSCEDYQTVYFVHREDDCRSGLDYKKVLQINATSESSLGEETCGSSYDESSADALSTKKSKKRNYAEMNISEQRDGKMSPSHSLSDPCPSKTREKKCKLTNVQYH